MPRNTQDTSNISRLPGLTIEVVREEDGRYLAEAPALPGVMVYGATESEAVTKVKALALRVLAERLEHGETGEAQAIAMALRLMAERVERGEVGPETAVIFQAA
jgi:predicted RNase H-like HicB family nuclease